MARFNPRLLAAAIPLIITASFVDAARKVGDVVKTQLGSVRGETVTEVGKTARIFRGLPYAAPPVGDLRWKAPQAPKSWQGVRDAIEWPNRCPQGESSMGAGGPISEDCLYLNVVTAAESSDDLRPVMVFFHGGGLTSGTGNSTTYNHPMLPSKGVVLVTVNSRLGPVGYLAHPALSAENEKGVSGNYGTLDLMASLQWVQANIKAFGGDPNNVTIFGESGGGVKTMSQMTLPMTKGLFHKAIVQSGSGSVMPRYKSTLKDAEAIGEKFVGALGVSDADNVLKAMREKPWQELIKTAANREVGFRATLAIDGYILPKSTNEMFSQGLQHAVPLIVGANAGERMLQTDVPLLGKMHTESSSAPSYLYNFTHLAKGWREEPGCVAFHGLELTYVFGAVPIGLESRTTQFLARGGGCSTKVPEHDDVDLNVADYSSTIWAQFAKTGNPSVKGLVEWPAYTPENKKYLNIGEVPVVGTGIEVSYIAPPERDN